jgi:hypothetical protein
MYVVAFITMGVVVAVTVVLTWRARRARSPKDLGSVSDAWVAEHRKGHR